MSGPLEACTTIAGVTMITAMARRVTTAGGKMACGMEDSATTRPATTVTIAGAPVTAPRSTLAMGAMRAGIMLADFIRVALSAAGTSARAGAGHTLSGTAVTIAETDAGHTMDSIKGVRSAAFCGNWRMRLDGLS